MSWTALDRELDLWLALDRRATLWWRDDDACGDTPALQRLLAIACAHDVPVAVAAIPAKCSSTLADAIAAFSQATIVQHGYAHANHAARRARRGARQSSAAWRAPDDLERSTIADATVRRAFGRARAAVEPIDDSLPVCIGGHRVVLRRARRRDRMPALRK
jgi:hypothetical protein